MRMRVCGGNSSYAVTVPRQRGSFNTGANDRTPGAPVGIFSSDKFRLARILLFSASKTHHLFSPRSLLFSASKRDPLFSPSCLLLPTLAFVPFIHRESNIFLKSCTEWSCVPIQVMCRAAIADVFPPRDAVSRLALAV